MTAQLTEPVRAGSLPDCGHLYERHRQQAWRCARSLVDQPADADELVAIAFEKILNIVRRGLGPDEGSFWSYLVVTLRHCAWSLQRERKLERLANDGFVADLASSDVLAAAVNEHITERNEIALIRAFKRLPNNYRLVLLLTEVEQQPPVNVAPLFKVSANAVAALAYRARGRLRELYLEELGKPQPTK